MSSLESLTDNFSFIYFFSSVVLLLGLFFLSFPLFARLLYTKKIRTFDLKTLVFLTLIVLIVVSSSQLVYNSARHPEVLFPFVVLTCGLKFLSPAMMVKKMKQKVKEKEKWERKKRFLYLISLTAGIYIILTTLTTRKELGVVEIVMTTFASSYTFSRIYFELLFRYRKEKGAWFHWLAGFFIAIAFIVLIPFLVPDYTIIFKLSGGTGWLGAFTYLSVAGEFRGKELSDSPELLRKKIRLSNGETLTRKKI